MQVQIRNCWSRDVIFTAEIPDDAPEQFRVRAAVRLAVSQRANLRGSNLRGSNLRGSDLTPIRDDFWAVLSAGQKPAHGTGASLV